MDKQWQEAVCAGRVCALCGKAPVAGHHILTKGAHPELRYDVTNGIALCVECHAKAHSRGISVFLEELRKADYEKWKLATERRGK